MFKVCLENHIISRSNDYKCCLCNYDRIIKYFDAVVEHIWDQRHQSLLVSPNRINGSRELHSLSLISENQRRIIVENQITIGLEQSYICHLCFHMIDNLVDVYEHIKSDSHQHKFSGKSIRKLSKWQRNRFSNEENESSSDQIPQVDGKEKSCLGKEVQEKNYSNLAHMKTVEEEHDSSLAVAVTEKNQIFVEQVEKINEEYESTLELANKTKEEFKFRLGPLEKCNPNLEDSLKQAEEVNDQNELDESEEVILFKENYFEKINICNHCQVPLTNFALTKCHCMIHLFSKINLSHTDIIQFKNEENKFHAKCLICCETMTSDKSLVEHLKTFTHKTVIEYFALLEAKNKKSIQIEIGNLPQVCGEPVYTSSIICKVCDVIILDSNINNHVKTQEHLANVLKLNNRMQPKEDSLKNDEENTGRKRKRSEKEKCEKIDDNLSYICFICDKTFTHASQLIQHYKTNATHSCRIEHLKTLSNILSESQVAHQTVPECIDRSVPECIDLSITECINLSDSDDGQSNIKKKIACHYRQPRKNKEKKEKLNESENSKSYGNLCLLMKDYIQMCIKKGARNIYEIRQEIVCQQGAAIRFICPYQSKLFCTLCRCEIEAMFSHIIEHTRSVKHANNLCDKDSKNGQNKLIKLAKEYMYKESDYYVYCCACDVRVPNFCEQIDIHTILSYHEERISVLEYKSKKLNEKLMSVYESNSWYYAQFFLCIICDARFLSELAFAIHLLSQKHVEAVKEFNSDDCQMKFDMCFLCLTYWYGPSEAYNDHCATHFHEYFLEENEFRILDLLPVAKELLCSTEEVIERLVEESDSILKSDCKKVKILLEHFERIVREIHPYTIVQTFGSRSTDIALSDSNVNIFCEYKNLGVTVEDYGAEYLYKLRDLIESQKENWIYIEMSVLPVPSMKLRHIETNLKCDIIFANDLSTEKSKLICNYVAAFPFCRRMILYLKKWLTYCQLLGTSSITTYALSWLVIFYLQSQGIVPSALVLLKSKERPVIINGWECGFVDINPTSCPTLSLRELLRGFFLYYSIFDYRFCIISPFLGQALQKSSFATTEDLPNELRTYKQRFSKGEIECFRIDFPMCIQDPVNHSQNLTKQVTKFQLRCFREYCHKSAAILINTDVTKSNPMYQQENYSNMFI